jgi:hypothetical protein
MPSKETKSEAAETKSTPLARNLQSTADKETKQGFRGTEVDSTPNENYTVAGVTAGKPTPETDAEQAKNIRIESGVGLSPLEAAHREKTQRGEK